MRIRSIAFDGIRGIPDRSFDLTQQGTGAAIVAVTGGPGAGKTTFLQALIAAKEDVGSYGGAPDTAALVRQGLSGAKIHVEWELSASEVERFGIKELRYSSETILGMKASETPPHEPVLEAVLSDYDPSPKSGKVEYFHAGRELPVGLPVDMSRPAGSVLDRMTRLGTANSKFEGLVRFIVASGLGLAAGPDGGQAKPGRITEAFGMLCQSKKLAGLYRVGDGVYPGFTNHEGATFGLMQLSDSERDALLFASSYVRSGLVDNEPGSVVLIDTPERFLGDADGAALVDALHRLGQNNQIIVATRSEVLLRNARCTINLGGQSAAPSGS